MWTLLRCARRLSLPSRARSFSFFPTAPPPPRNPNPQIQLLDADLWGLSSRRPPPPPPRAAASSSSEAAADPSDEIDDLRIRKALFYKMEKHSREHDERSVRFHKTKSARHRPPPHPKPLAAADAKDTSKRQRRKKKTKKTKTTNSDGDRRKIDLAEDDTAAARWTYRESAPREPVASAEGGGGGTGDAAGAKRVRTPTFNELTEQYHRPFCLDICITKGSARACVVHRATSRVVAVAHSISKDMRFDLSSRKDVAACAAVGAALAQRALADDIYNVVYTPRKGERIEGKIQVVLQAIIDGGVDVRVKVRQRRPLKAAAKPRDG